MWGHLCFLGEVGDNSRSSWRVGRGTWGVSVETSGGTSAVSSGSGTDFGRVSR